MRMPVLFAGALPIVVGLVLACAGTPGSTPTPPAAPGPDARPDAPTASPQAPAMQGFATAREAPPHPRAVRTDTDSPSPCQPRLHIPGETPLVDAGGGYQRLADDTDPASSVVRRLGERRAFDGPVPSLPQGRRVEVHEWTCDPSDRDFVVAVFDGEERIALYTHVHHYRLGDDGRRLLLQNYTQDGSDWKLRHRLIDLHTLDAVELPAVHCIGWRSELTGDGLFTLGEWPEWSPTQHACIFGPDGELRGYGTWPSDNLTRARAVSMQPPVVAVLTSSCALVVADLATGEGRMEHDADDEVPCMRLWKTHGALTQDSWPTLGTPLPPAQGGAPEP